MFKIGESVMYGSNGVMNVVDVREETVGDVNRTYYVLECKDTVGSFIFVPTDNESLVGNMRHLMSRDEAEELIATARDIPQSDWPADSRKRADYFKTIIDSADQRQIVGMIKAINVTGMRRISEGKKNYLTDEGAKSRAERVLYSELSAVLGIDFGEVAKRLRDGVECVSVGASAFGGQ